MSGASNTEITMISKAVRFHHCILLFGSQCCKTPKVNVIFVYNIYTEQWRKYLIPSNGKAPTLLWQGMCLQLINETIYMFGGLSKDRKVFNKQLSELTNKTGCYVWNEVSSNSADNAPPPRCMHQTWEYSNKLWTFGGLGPAMPESLSMNGDFVASFSQHGRVLLFSNNQLLCFDPSCKEWTSPKCYGIIPPPRFMHATTKIGNKVWLYGGHCRSVDFNDLYELDMPSFTWTCIQTNQPKPPGLAACMLTAVTDHQIVLHGGAKQSGKRESDIWILDLKSHSWQKYVSNNVDPSSFRSTCRGMNSSIISVGGMGETKSFRDMSFYVMLEPKSLQQLAVKIINKHQDTLQWKRFLPNKLTNLFRDLRIKKSCLC